jgi:N-acetyl-anhydromuramyl-L-alanine amidase AmpD
MNKPIKVTVSVCSLFSVNNSPTPRWGSQSSHPVANATVELEGTGIRATTNRFGHAQLDVSALASGDYVLALAPHADNLLRTSGGSVNASDGNSTDKPGICRYRPLRLQVTFTLKEGAVKMDIGSPCDGATHGAAFFQMPTTLLIDWKPDWVACKHKGARPKKAAPTMVLIHRTDAGTPGSSLDDFIPSPISKTSHYLVDVDGHIIKLVHEDMVANHAGESWWAGTAQLKYTSVGIEIVNKTGPFTAQQYDAVGRIVRDLQTRYPGITRHNILAHGDVRVEKATAPQSLKLVERSGCPGVQFDWRNLETAGLCSKADPSLFKESQIDGEYGGYFKDKPTARLALFAKDATLLRKDKTPYGVIASLQADLSSLGYSVFLKEPDAGENPYTGEFDVPTQAAVDRFRRRYMFGIVPDNHGLNPIFDRATAIALKRVLLDRQR